MSHSVILPPVHDTSPPPFDDDVDENDTIPTIQNDELFSSNSPDVLNNSNDEWKSVDENNDTDIAQIEDDIPIVHDENVVTNINPTTEENNDDWANFASFENKIDEIPKTTSAVIEENTENGWADFESNTFPSFEQPIQSSNNEQPNKVIEENDDDDDFGEFTEQPNKVIEENDDDDFGEFTEQPIQSSNVEQTNQVIEQEDDDDDFGEFSEVQVAAPQPQTSSLPTDTLSTEQIESLISTCFPMKSVPSSTDNDSFISTELPSFTTYKDQTKAIPCLESSLSLWNVLSNLSNDPVGIKFQWRKSNTERLFHQALGVNERFRTKNVSLTPEILQPEKVKPLVSTNNESENIDNENKLPTETIRPHFDWKQSGLENPLADNDSSSLSSNISKNEDNGFDANKTLDLDFYVPTMKSSNEEEQITSPSSIPRNDSPVIQQQRHSIPIKTNDLYPGSTTTFNDDAKRIVDSLPNLNFMSAKSLMFPIRFNANNNDGSTTLY